MICKGTGGKIVGARKFRHCAPKPVPTFDTDHTTSQRLCISLAFRHIWKHTLSPPAPWPRHLSAVLPVERIKARRPTTRVDACPPLLGLHRHRRLLSSRNAAVREKTGEDGQLAVACRACRAPRPLRRFGNTLTPAALPEKPTAGSMHTAYGMARVGMSRR